MIDEIDINKERGRRIDDDQEGDVRFVREGEFSMAQAPVAFLFSFLYFLYFLPPLTGSYRGIESRGGRNAGKRIEKSERRRNKESEIVSEEGKEVKSCTSW